MPLRIPVKLVAGSVQRPLADDLARELNVALEAAEVTAFADGETQVHLAADVRGAAVCFLQSTGPPVNDNLMTLAFLINAARAAGAVQVTAVVPYFGYARQEQRSRVGDSRSAQVVARLLDAVGLDQLVTLDLHAPALESALPMPTTLLQADEVFLPLVRSWSLNDLVVVGPDAGGLKRAQRYARALGSRVVVIAKDRPRPDQAEPVQVLGDVRHCACLIVDDLASTGRTLAGAAAALQQAGAREIHALFTHPVMAPGAWERLLAAPLGRIVTSDSIPIPPRPRLEVVRIAPLLARTVRSLTGEVL
jgi:ribose-phosphate pyrophosphokinase